MQFTVTLELEKKEEIALSKGNFHEIRKEFFTNLEFCKFVIQNYEINADFLKLALTYHKLSDLKIKDIFKKFNLLELPGIALSNSDLIECLYFLEINDYSIINFFYWHNHFEKILQFFGTAKSIIVARKSQCTNLPFDKNRIVAPNLLYQISVIRKLIEKNNIELVKSFILSDSLKTYWNDKKNIPVILEALHPIKSQIKELPIPKENLNVLLECAQTENDEDYIWPLKLYVESAKKYKVLNFTAYALEVLAYHKIDLDICLDAYKNEKYVTDQICIDDIRSWTRFEKKLMELNPKVYSNLEQKAIEDAKDNSDTWFFISCDCESYICNKIRKVSKKF